MRRVFSEKIRLPEGFHLEEDEDFLYLYFQGEEIAIFSSAGVEPTE